MSNSNHGSRPSRRRLLGAVGTVLTVGVAGCTSGPSRPTYDRRTVEPPADAEPRTAAETTAAALQATTETSDAVVPVEAVTLTDHAFVFESGYLGATVQGTVRNDAESQVGIAEVRVRVYNDADQLLGQYVDTGSDLAGGKEWSFTVLLLESPSDIAAYEITALGTPV